MVVVVVGALLAQLKGFLLLLDDGTARAFPDPADPHAVLWNAHRVLVNDNDWFNSDTMAAIQSFFDDLPTHLKEDGVLFDAPFATMTVRDTFKCNGENPAGGILGFTARGFNVFQVQAGSSDENAFPSDTPEPLPVRGDLLLTVLR